MNISEANAANVLIDYSLRGIRRTERPATTADAVQAAHYLADRAHRALSAGVTPDQVEVWAVGQGIAAPVEGRVYR
jgi:hypothetical protein